MILGRITLDPTNLGVIGGMVGSVAALYGARLSWRKQLDERADNILESIERERDYWKTEAELWRRRCMTLTEHEGISKWPELD